VLALAKTNLPIAGGYFRLVGEPADQPQFAALIVREYQRCCAAMLETTGQPRLLDDVPWLRDSIGRRSPFVDALNLLQIGLMNRLRAAAGEATPDADEWAHSSCYWPRPDMTLPQAENALGRPRVEQCPTRGGLLECGSAS
jgi:phosphoenolpyruvate carboxylase